MAIGVTVMWIGAYDRDRNDVIRYVNNGDIIPNNDARWSGSGPQHVYNTYEKDCVPMHRSGDFELWRCDDFILFVRCTEEHENLPICW